MKLIKYTIALAIAALGLTACQDHIDAPSPESLVPHATLQANISIKDLKTAYWQDGLNYTEQITVEGLKQKMPSFSGDKVVISGRVVSSDEASNVFKSLVIQNAYGDDRTCISMSINKYSLYVNYRLGQEIVIDLTGMYIGKYCGLEQLGYPEDYNGGTQASFMSPEFFQDHAELNGLPQPSLNDTITFDNFSEIANSTESLIALQSQLVRFNNVKFVEGGTGTFSTYHENGNQTLEDINGDQTIIVRTSGYSNFWNKTCPEGYGDVVGILSYYDTGSSSGTKWQLILNAYNGCMNFGNPTVPKGDEGNPYTVDEAVELINAGTEPTDKVWVSGYIVGTVAPEVTKITSNSDIEWGADATLANTMVVGPVPYSAESPLSIASCLVIELPQGSDLRNYGNLRDNPDNLNKQIWLKGVLGKVLSSPGITGNNGTVNEFRIEGLQLEDTSGIADGNGSESSPYSTSQVLSGAATGSNVWVAGYIVGYIPDKTFSEAVIGADGAVQTNVIIANTADETNINKCIPVQLPSGDLRTAVNLSTNPGNLGKKLSYYGEITTYFGTTGLKNGTAWSLDGTSTTPDTPVTPTGTFTAGRVSSVTSGKLYAIGLDANCVAPLAETYTYGYLPNATATVSGNQVTLDAVNGWTIESTTGGYTLKDSYGRYIYQTGTYNSFNVSTSLPATGGVWTITFNTDKTVKITNVATGKTIQYSASYGNWGAYADVTDSSLPYLFLEGAAGEDPGSGNTPDTPSTGDYKGDFDTFNGGVAKSTYGTYTNATGWTATNCNILSGSSSGDNNPKFEFIGSESTLAPCMNGKVTTPGEILSPTLTGGIGTLTFNYGFAYAETSAQFTVNVLQNGSVVKTQTVTCSTIEQKHAYSFSMECNLTGDFVIQIVNDCLNASTSNKDRVAIWNLTWTD